MIGRTARGSFTRLAACTCRALPSTRAPQARYSSDAQTASSPSPLPADRSPSSSSGGSEAYATPSTSYKFSNPTDAYDSVSASGQPSTEAPSQGGSSSPDPFSTHSHSVEGRSNSSAAAQAFASRREQGKALRAQRQTLSAAEAQTFADLLGELLPESSAGASLFDTPSKVDGLGPVRNAVGRKTGEKVRTWERKQRTELSLAEENELDSLREEMSRFQTDHELLAWAMKQVFGFSTEGTVLPDPRFAPALVPGGGGPNSRIYPDLLLDLFLLLRDTHKSPQTALSIFALASATAHSYVSGCTTKLYNEVLRTRWAEGDVQSVADGVEEMQRAGVRMNEDTSQIIASMGEAIRADRLRAELRADLVLAKMPLGVGRTPDEVERLVERSRFFSAEQVDAWVKCENEVELVQRQWEDTVRRRADQRRSDWEKKRESREELDRALAHRESPNRFFRQARDSPLRGVAPGGAKRGDGRGRDFYKDEGEGDEEDSWKGFPVDRSKSVYAREREAVPEEREPWAAFEEQHTGRKA